MYFLFLISCLCETQSFSDIKELNRILKPFLAVNNLIVSVEDELYKFFNNNNVTISLDNDKENCLTIQFNDIKNNVLPECLGRLINIKILILKKNSLSELPEFFERFTSLWRLDLSSNDFNKLPKVLFLLKSLTRLYFRSNKFKYLGDDIKNFKGLEVLDFSENDIRAISEEFKNLPKLRILNFNNNNNIIRTSDDDMDYKKDIDFLNKIPKSVESLYINNTRLRYIICNIKLYPNLSILCVKNNFIKNLFCYCDKCISTKTNDLSPIYHLQKLKELDLCENPLECSFFIAKNMFLALEKLDLTLCNITKFEVEGYNIMNSRNGKYIKKYENTSTLYNSKYPNNASNMNNSEPRIIYSLQHLSITIANSYVVPNLLIFPNLLYLKITNKERNHLRIIANIVRPLFDGLSKMKFLNYLNLYRFNLVTIPEKIYNLKNLESLLLNYCKVCEIQDEIKNLSNLTKVDLRYNNIENINPKIFTFPRPIKIVLTKNPLKYLPSSINNDNTSFTLNVDPSQIDLFKQNNDNLGIMDISYKKIHQVRGYIFNNMSSITIEDLYKQAHKEEYKWELNKMLKIKIKEVEESKYNYNIIIKYWNILEKYITHHGRIKEKFPNYLQLLYGIKKGEEIQTSILIKKNIKNYIGAIFKILTNLINIRNTKNIETIIREMETGLSGCIIDQLHHFSYAYHLSLFDYNESKSTESFICNEIALLKYHALKEIITNNNEEQNINLFSNWQNILSETLGLPSIPQKCEIYTNNMFLQCKEYIIYQFFKLMNVENVVKYLYEYINNNPKNVTKADKYISSRQQSKVNLKEYIKHEECTSITEKGIYFILEEMGLIKKVENKRMNENI